MTRSLRLSRTGVFGGKTVEPPDVGDVHQLTALLPRGLGFR
ncbi:hypothetical protein [Streptomyces sp. Isolate_45]|nr:hypothetical protein [Streptomyces sp. Isolate_45]MDA5281177.1 hypothetical protein [Streptomyces sp. Isolate_45]